MEMNRKLLKTQFHHLLLPELFSNIERGKDCPWEGTKYIWSSPRGHEGYIAFGGRGQMNIYVDNFPGPKLKYTTTFPIKTLGDFVNYCESANVLLNWK